MKSTIMEMITFTDARFHNSDIVGIASFKIRIEMAEYGL